MGHYSAITGWGMKVPERVLTNADFERIVDTSDEWITSRTGIKQRHIVSPGEKASTLSIAAARQALERAGLEGKDLDLIIVATVCPDYRFPATANLVQHALGAQCGAFDMQAACSGFLYAVSVAHQFIANGSAKHALVIGVEVLSQVVDFKDRSTCVLFGDGAGAIVLSASDEPGGLLGFTIGSDGARPELLWIPAGGSAEPITEETLRERRNYVQMNGSEVFKFATRIMGTAMEEALANAGMTAADMDLFIPHQANLRIIEAASKRLNLPRGEGLRQHRELRQHLRRRDPDRALRGDRPGTRLPRRAPGHGRLRRGAHLGRRRREVDCTSAHPSKGGRFGAGSCR